MHNLDIKTTLIYNNYLYSLSEIITCLCIADFEDEDYVPDSDHDMRKDDLDFMRHSDYHERFLAFNDNSNSNDNDDPDALYEIWWEENIQEGFENRMYQGECFDGAYKIYIFKYEGK